MVKRVIQNDKLHNYGVMGEPTAGRTTKGDIVVRVGDIVSYEFSDGFPTKGVIAVVDGKAGVMGSHSTGIKGLKNLQIIVPHNLVTNDLLNYLHGRYLTILEAKKMTLSDIEEKLGYYIELVEE